MLLTEMGEMSTVHRSHSHTLINSRQTAECTLSANPSAGDMHIQKYVIAQMDKLWYLFIESVRKKCVD